MKLLTSNASHRGSVFVLVLWISFGLVVLSLYFANSMSFELKSADNRLAAAQANMAINGATRYVEYIISNYGTNGVVPDPQYYRSEWVPVGESSFWYLAQPINEVESTQLIPMFGLVDECSKLNLNTATAAMLQALPGITVEFAAAIIDWRDDNSEPSESGAESDIYQRLDPPRTCKNAPFESVDELRLVYGATIEMLYGEDINRNGILDPNENDGDLSLPLDNADGRLDQGIITYLTVHTSQLNTRPDGTARVSVNNRQNLRQLLEDNFDTSRANEILGPLGNQQFASILGFYAASQMTPDEFAAIEDSITTSTNAVVQGLVNVNTASQVVLACIPGIGEAKAAELVAHRAGNTTPLTSIAWVKDILDSASIEEAGPYLTGRTFQFTADIVALGRFNRGYRRTRFIFDATQSPPRIAYRQDLTHLGWALGRQVRQNLELELESRL